MARVAAAFQQLGYTPQPATTPAQIIRQQQSALGIIGLGLGQPLPRPDETYISNFGPSKPIIPFPIDTPRNGRERPEPRYWEYPVGYNLPTAPGDIKLVQFAQLRSFADIYDVARHCIRIRTQAVRDLDWDIVVDQQQVADQGKDAFKVERLTYRAFWQRPQWEYDDLSSWLSALMELLLTIDAAGLYPAPSAGKAGRTGSGIAEIQLVDGATLKPLLDTRGGRPRPPSPAYQQYIWGIPRVDLLQATGMTAQELFRDAQVGEQFTADQLLYVRKHVRVNSPYGFSPLEQSVVNTMIALNRQEWLAKYFQEGSLPQMFMEAPPSWTPDQMREYEQQINDLGSSDLGQRHKVRLIPAGANPIPAKDTVLTTDLDKFLLDKTCAAFDVTPQELGFNPTSGLGGKGFGDAMENVQFRKSLLPDKSFLERLITRISHEHLGMPQALEFKFLGFDAKEDALTQAQINQTKISTGEMTIDEARELEGKPAFGHPLTSTPFYITRTGLTPLDPTVAVPAAEPKEPDALTPEEPVTPADTAPAKPAATPDTPEPDDGAVTKALIAEARVLGKFLAKRDWRPGRPFAGERLDAHQVALLSQSPETHRRVVEHLEKRADAEAQTKRDEQALVPLLVAAIQAGDVTKAVALLREAYQRQYAAGAAYWTPERVAPFVASARGENAAQLTARIYDLLGTAPTSETAVSSAPGVHPLDTTPAMLAERQRAFLSKFVADVESGDLSDDQINARAADYAATLWGARQAGVHRYAPSGVYWQWETSAGGDVCGKCAGRNGQVYSDADLPGYPGDGGFGELCDGGPKCRCDLIPLTQAEYEAARG